MTNNKLILFLITLLMVSFYSINLYPEEQIIDRDSRDNIVNVFNKAISLNEEFKKNLGKMPLDEYNKMRQNLEQYEEEMMAPALEKCVLLLSEKEDKLLTNQFFKLLISNKNSADESFIYALAEIFINNPDQIINGIKSSNSEDILFLYQELCDGWFNVIFSEDISDEKILRSVKKLKSLNIEIGYII